MQYMVELVTRLIWKSLADSASVLPEHRALRAAQLIGGLIHLSAGTLRAQVENDLYRAFRSHDCPVSPRRIRRLGRQSFLHLAMNLTEFMRFPRLDKSTLNEKVAVTGRENLEAVMHSGRGGVILTLHMGNWELQGAWYGLNGYPMNAVFINQYNRLLGEEMNKLRYSAGISLVPRSELRRAVRLLKQGELVGVLADQDGGSRGEFFPFFGRIVSAPPTPAWLAARAGAWVLPVHIIRERGRHHRLFFHPPLAAPDRSKKGRHLFTQRTYRLFESIILANPDQWLWLYRRWKKRSHTDQYMVTEHETG